MVGPFETYRSVEALFLIVNMSSLVYFED